MATRRSGFRALARLAATAAALAACGCDASTMVEQLQETKLTVEVTAVPVKRPPPAPSPSLASSIAIVPPPPRDLSGPPRLDLTERRFAGGRPIRWWSDRLGRLRKEGPRDLYDLTLGRARLCGLTVEERPDGEVAVSVPLAPTAAAAAPGPEARP